MASERCRARVKRLRSDWFLHRMPAMREHPEQIVFIDGKEDQKTIRWIVFPTNAVKTNLIRLRGRPLRGQRLVMDAPFGSWCTQTFIAGLTTDTLIAPWVIKGAMDGDAFAAYIRQVLVPELAPRTVVGLDNLATHRNAEAARAIREAGCRFLYLPPYSPDLNPIEINRALSRTHGVRALIFAKLKAHLRRIGARSFTQVFEAIGRVCQLFDPTECWNYFKAAGYGAG